VATLLTACTASPPTEPPAPVGPGPAEAIAQFVADWQGGRTQDAAGLTTDPAAAAMLLTGAMSDLGATRLGITTGTPTKDDESAAHRTATVAATLTWTIPAVGTWRYHTRWTWVTDGEGAQPRWLLEVAPTVVHPDLGPGQSLAVRLEPATDGPIVDRNDTQLISSVRVYSVVLLIDKVQDLTATAKALARLLSPIDPSVTVGGITAGVAHARAAGQDSYTVTNLRETDYAPLESRLMRMGGLTFPSEVRDLPPQAGFAAALLGTALPVAAAMTKGTPGWRIVTTDGSGGELTTLDAKAAKPGPKVTLTLDPAIQEVAQTVVDGVAEPSVIVAMQPSTGEILAVAQNGAASAEGPIALMGRYPPGSTFKIVTAAAALARRLVTPTAKVACPGEWTTQHRTIHNEGFALGTVTATAAFAHSCNTTFAMLAARMPPEALPDAAAQFGVGPDFDVQGITTLTGSVDSGESVLARAENGFGQGTDLVTPLSAALMAATAANGVMPTPVLIRGTKATVDRTVPPVPDSVAKGVRTMMRAVVTDGTAKGLRGDGEVYAKTGTAEYVGPDKKIHAHAWTVGFRGDVAFSALIVGGDSSKRTNDLVHTFLAGIPAP
jgi:cell division protein FtsI/penicillin-binding protein 2